MTSPLENCLINIARNLNGISNELGEDDYLRQGATIVKDKIVEEENPVYLSRVEVAEILFNLGGTKDLSSARGVLEGIYNEEVYCEEGQLYFESADKGMAIGYSSNP